MTPERYQQIGQLYQTALAREPAQRAAFLAEACGKDDALRREVASLLAAHDKAGDFIEHPPDDIAAGWQLIDVQMGDRFLPREFAHYRLLSLLGKGGMGKVYLAEDTRLKRKVALKLLPAEFTADPDRVRRFAQEARAASALNHPNIVTIHEIGELSTNGVAEHYIVTEYVDGQTLRQRLADAPQRRLATAEALDVAAQVAAALTAAHEAGIVHRDIKPENVMVRRDSLVKVLDFGLAKLTETSDSGGEQASSETSTAAGVVLGTPRYMSPEQARGEKVDARTDLFSFGVMTYEMLAGRAPFAGATMSEILAALLRDKPAPLPEDTPLALQNIVYRALRKDRAERYQRADELRTDVSLCKEGMSAEKFVRPPSDRVFRERTLPPEDRKTNRRRLLIALAGVVLVAIATWAWVHFKRAPALTEKDTILVADFENQTGEAVFDQMLKQGLAIQLQQTPFLTLFPEARMRHELTLMKRPPNERVTAELARQICERQNLKAYITGELAPLGSHYVVMLEAFNGQNGETLARAQAQVSGKEQVLQALSQAATDLRSLLGESLSSIQRFDRSLQEGTTDKPEAFKAYAQAIDLAVSGRLTEAIPFYQRAVEIDPEFAHAYSQIGIMYWALGQPERALAYAEKSYELKDRAGEIERSRIVSAYHRIVTGNLEKSIEASILHQRTFPREYVGPTDSALTYSLLGRYEPTIVEARESIRLNPRFAAPHNYLALGLLRTNHFAEAKDIVLQAIEQNLELPPSRTLLYQIAFLDQGKADMQQQLDGLRGKPNEHLTFDLETSAAAYAGQWHGAKELARRALVTTTRLDTREWAARFATEQALRGALLGDCRQARIDATQGLQFTRGRAALTRAALALAFCGDAKPAQALIDDLSKRYPEDTLVQVIWLPLTHAALALQRGQAAQAVEQLQATTRYEAAAEFWPQYLRGQAFLKLGKGTEAAAEFQKILDHRGYAPLSLLYPLAHVGLARAAAITGDAQMSRKAYEDFLAVWKEADTDLPVLQAATRAFR